MTAPRSVRIAQQIKRELSEIIRRDLKDERIAGIVSVTDVEVSGDCRYVKVFISVYGDEAAQKGTVDALTELTGYIRGEICRRLSMRFAPEMIFRLDNSLERGAKVSELIAKISRGEI